MITKESANEMLKQKLMRLNIELIETRTISKTKIDEVKKESKKEIKAWRKELGEERGKNIKLEQELKDTIDNAFEEENPLPVAREDPCQAILRRK